MSLDFPEFDNIKVSTKTFTANTNLVININALFEYLTVVEYTVVPKKRGRKKKTEVEDPCSTLSEGSIISLENEGKLKGVKLKTNNKNTGKKKWFRNSITVVMWIDKFINFKICRNGTFQMTGCKTYHHAQNCVKNIWGKIKDKEEMFSYTRGSNLQILIIPSMRNIDFSLNFIVDREKLNKYMYNQKKFHCLLETSFGYTGVNIKIPIDKEISQMKIGKLEYIGEKWTSTTTTYSEYLNLLPEKDQNIKKKLKKYNTFLVFHSGKVIMSGISSELMRESYYYFLDIIKTAYPKIEEKLNIKDDDDDDIDDLTNEINEILDIL